jgi:primosomal protein N' (replication factor Y)
MFAQIIISSQSKEIDRIFHYKVPDGMAVETGSRVIVPFGLGNKEYEGYVVAVSETCEFAAEKLKFITRVLDEYPVFTEKALELALFMKEKYFSTLSQCLQLMIPAGIKLRGGLRRMVKQLSLNENADFSGITKTQAKVVDYLRENALASKQEVAAQTGVTYAVCKTLLEKGILNETEVVVRRKPYLSDIFSKTENLELNLEQKEAVAFISGKMNNGNTKPTLIQGVTGSGKTEIYLRIIEEVLKKGLQVIVLVPEISLTPQAAEVFTGRFGKMVSVTHSKLSAGERFDQWERARFGEISIMIGPRSALFTPFSKTGLIIIDEEHEHSYKSESPPKYSAKEIALKLSALHGAHVVFGSATPCLESYYEAETGKFDLVKLSERVNKTMPQIYIEDMRIELKEGNLSLFSRALSSALKETLENKQQAILFLNRRGHSTFVSCRKCGYVCKCDNCNVNYTYHKYNNSLLCHYCGKSAAVPENCPQCGSKYIKYFGIGTQRVEEEVKKLFPEAEVLRMDADTTGVKHGHEKILTAFRQNKANILIGTQMIAKGLDYPNVTLVGIISADVSLNSNDFRSGETTFQLLTQVAGRAGRAALTGRVFIQTYSPEHYSIEYSKQHDYEGFYNHEIAVRRQMIYPPFSKIFTILFTGTDERNIIKLLFNLSDIMNHYNKDSLFETIGPAPAFISKIKDSYRWRLIVKSEDEDKLRLFCLFCVEKLKKIRDMSQITVSLTPNPVTIQ